MPTSFSPTPGRLSTTRTSCPASRKGSERSSTASTMLKIAVFAPMPSASVRITTVAKPGLFQRTRKPYRRSCSRVPMSGKDAFWINRVAAYGYLIYDQQMGVRWCIVAALVIGAGETFAQKTKEIHGPMWAGPDVSPPRVLRDKHPTYSEEARKAQVQGTVFLRLIVDEKGHPTNITVVSPL